MSPGKRSRTDHRGVGYAEKGHRPATEETQNHLELKISVMWGAGKGEDRSSVCALAFEQARRPEEEQAWRKAMTSAGVILPSSCL